MAILTYKFGDVLEQKYENPTIIVHVCNNIGKWGAGFTRALSNRCARPERVFRYASENKSPEQLLGETSFASLQAVPPLVVANMVAQNGIKSKSNPVPINYDALSKCLSYVGEVAIRTQFDIAGPRFGSDRAGGDWKIIEKIIMSELVIKGVNVTIYTLSAEKIC